MLRNSLRLVGRSFGYLPRIVLIGAMLLLFAVATVVLAMRHWILPDISRYHGVITSKVSQVVGRPVLIGKIEADWRGLRPHLLFTDVRIMDAQGGTALALSSVDNVVSWMTLVTGEVRLYSLELDQPNLLIRRDMEGLLHIADVPLSRQESNKGAGADWLLHQTRIIVRNARIIWLDEQRAAPALVLDQVNLHIENSGHQHRFAMRAQPPAQLSAQLDVRGNFLGKSFDKLDLWSGQLFVQIDNTHSEAWRTWLPLPPEIQRGTGAVRAWVVAEEGKIVQVTADLIAANVQAQLAEDLPALDMVALRGRVTWRQKPKDFEVTTRKLSLQMRDGLTVPPTDLFLRLSAKGQPKGGVQDKFGDKGGDEGGKSADQQLASGELRTNTLDLQSVVTLAHYLPIKPEWKQQLAEYAPHGLISNTQAKWQMSAQKLQHFDIKSHFDGLSVARVGKFPGFSGLSGEISGSDTSGRLALKAHNVTLDAPEIMMEALVLNTLSGELGWQSKDGGMEIKFNNVAVVNDDIAGNSFGSYQTVPGSRGIIDLTVHLNHASVRHTARYIPLHLLGEQAHSWIRDALLDGQADEFRLRLQGDLKDFPFDGNRKGMFEIKAKAKEVAVEYDKAWPVIENGAAELLIQGKRLEVNVATATTMGLNLKKVSVVVPDFTSPELMLEVRGEAEGTTLLALDFIRQSPVRGYLSGFTDNATASGNGHLALQLNVPLRGSKPVTVSGNYQFFDNDLTLGGMIPSLIRTSGMLSFTESIVSTRNVTTQIFGGPAALSVQRDPSGTVKINASGSADMASLRKTLSHPVLNYLQGGSAWKTDILVQGKQVSGVFYSDLIGLSSDLPAPFSKQADASLPLRLEKKVLSPEREMVSAQLGSLLDVKLWGAQKNDSFDVKRGTVVFGKGGEVPRRDGIWVSGTVPVLLLSGWEPLLGSGSATPEAHPASNTQAPIRLAGIDLLIEKIGGYGYMADNLRINARNPKGLMLAQLSSDAINGELRWQPQGNGKLVARLKNLSPYKGNIKKPDEGMKGSEKNAQLDAIQKNRSTAFPALDVTIDSLVLAGNNLGRLDLVGEQHERNWQLERVRLTNADGVLSADGKWQMGEKEQTVLNVRLDINNAGKILSRFGYPNTVRRGSGRLEGSFTWQGAPAEFSYAKLNGTLKVDTVKGQFLEIDPGFGKLLSILSLQALPRHVSLDFADVFSKGFAFDNIIGNGIIEGGVLSTDDFKILGSSAKVNMVGQVDLNRETQNLQVRVFPTVGNSVSLLGFVGGPAVGVGVFLANKLLKDPLDKLVSFEYNVSGSWAEPNVKKMDRN